jgi:hypothetical protein
MQKQDYFPSAGESEFSDIVLATAISDLDRSDLSNRPVPQNSREEMTVACRLNSVLSAQAERDQGLLIRMNEAAYSSPPGMSEPVSTPPRKRQREDNGTGEKKLPGNSERPSAKRTTPSHEVTDQQVRPPSKRYKGDTLSGTAKRMGTLCKMAILPTPNAPPSGQPRDKPVKHDDLRGLFSELIGCLLEGKHRNSTAHDMKGCLLKHNLNLQRFLAAAPPKKHSKTTSIIRWDVLDQSFTEFGETGKALQQILRQFRQKRKDVEPRPVFDNEFIAFPCLRVVTSGGDGDPQGKMGEPVPHGKRQGSRTQEDSEAATYESCSPATGTLQPVKAAATAERETDTGRLHGPAAQTRIRDSAQRVPGGRSVILLTSSNQLALSLSLSEFPQLVCSLLLQSLLASFPCSPVPIVLSLSTSFCFHSSSSIFSFPIPTDTLQLRGGRGGGKRLVQRQSLMKRSSRPMTVDQMNRRDRRNQRQGRRNTQRPTQQQPHSRRNRSRMH